MESHAPVGIPTTNSTTNLRFMDLPGKSRLAPSAVKSPQKLLWAAFRTLFELSTLSLLVLGLFLLIPALIYAFSMRPYSLVATEVIAVDEFDTMDGASSGTSGFGDLLWKSGVQPNRLKLSFEWEEPIIDKLTTGEETAEMETEKVNGIEARREAERGQNIDKTIDVEVGKRTDEQIQTEHDTSEQEKLVIQQEKTKKNGREGKSATKWKKRKKNAGAMENLSTIVKEGYETNATISNIYSAQITAPPVHPAPQPALPAPLESCDLTSGQWLKDPTAPLYDGLACRHLAKPWACRRGKNSDFEFEKYRWKPSQCDLPYFDGASFVELMRNRVITFVGDSLNLQMFQSLLCIADSAQGPRDKVLKMGKKYGFYTEPGHRSPNGWAYNFTKTNVTIVYASSVSLCEIVQFDKKNWKRGAALHLDRIEPAVEKFFWKSDVMVLNTGHHWNTNKRRVNNWTLYWESKPKMFRKDKGEEMSFAKGLVLNRTMQWLDTQMQKMESPPLVMLRMMSPRHFMNGEWNTGGRCDFLKMGDKVTHQVTTDRAAELAVLGTQVRLLNITTISEMRGEAHIAAWDYFNRKGKMDCLHWCLPGIPDMWNELLFWEIVKHDRKRIGVIDAVSA